MNANAFSIGRIWLLETGNGCGNDSAKRRVQSSGRNQPQNVALPAWGDKRWSVNSIRIVRPSPLNSNPSATVW